MTKTIVKKTNHNRTIKLTKQPLGYGIVFYVGEVATYSINAIRELADARIFFREISQADWINLRHEG